MKQQNTQVRERSHAVLSARDLRGVILPLTTPFDAAGEINRNALRANIRRWNGTGINGYVALGSTGERVHLDEREYLGVIATTRAEVPSGHGGLAFIVGAGQQSTHSSIREIKLAAAAGADAVLVITPHYYRPSITQQALTDHYRAVADQSPLPVILYSMPALTGVKIEPGTVARLSEHENIIGVKDSSADVAGLEETIRLCPGSFAVLTGNGTVLNHALFAGASGSILAVGCVVPELCVEIFDAVQNGDRERVTSLQERLSPLAAAVTTKHGLGGLKAALDMAGYTGGAVRSPLREPGPDARDEIRILFDAAKSILTAEEVTESA